MIDNPPIFPLETLSIGHKVVLAIADTFHLGLERTHTAMDRTEVLTYQTFPAKLAPLEAREFFVARQKEKLDPG